ncbi:MAG: DUF975 family protein [Lachnospiraceae bacterium]|nr:DUF975 family protein [Lachnospiraceae bacterium]
MYSSIKTLKANAREQLLSHMRTAVFFTIFYIAVSNLCSFCLMVFPGGGSILELLIYEFTTLLINLFNGLLQAGVAAFYLNVATNREHCSVHSLFYAFSHGPDRIMKVSLVLSLIQMVCTLPYVIYTLFIMPSYTMEALMNLEPEVLKCLGIAYLLLGAGELIYFMICLFFEPIYFMLVDMPGLSVAKALKMSIWLMKGSKFRLLGLKLSFLPLQCVSLFTFGIGNLWVTPYMNTTAALFYTDLSAKRINQ